MSMRGGGSSSSSGPNWDASDVPPLGFLLVHGTTNVGLAAKEFQILATDGRLSERLSDKLSESMDQRSEDCVIIKDDDKKLFVISQFSNIYCTAAGKVGPWDRMYKYVKEAVSKEEQRTGNPTTAEFAMDMLFKHCSECKKERLTSTYTYEGIIAGWPTGGVGQMYEFWVFENKPQRAEIRADDCSTSIFKQVAAAGSGYGYAARYMATLDKIILKDELEGAKRCLETVFRAGSLDPFTGGTSVVVCLKEGSCHLKFSMDALDTYSHCYSVDVDEALFLFVPGKTTLMASEIKNAWPGIKINAAHPIAITSHFTFHRIIFVTKYDKARAEQAYLGGDEPDLANINSPDEFLAALHVVNVGTIKCHLSRKSKSIIDLIRKMK